MTAAQARLLTLVLAASGCFNPTGSPGASNGTAGSTGAGGSSTGGTTSGGASTGEAPTTGTTGPVDCAEGRPFVGLDDTLELVRQDFYDPSQVEVGDRAYVRYFSLVHLYNAGECDDAIEVHRRALSKLANSLSVADDIAAPRAIDAQRLLFRVDLRDYGWDGAIAARDSMTGAVIKSYPNAWEMLADLDPYAVQFLGEAATEVTSQTGAARFLLAADAFVALAARPPMYHDMMRLPLTRAELETIIQLDVKASVAAELISDADAVARAAIHESNVSANHRAIQRHTFPNAPDRSYWLSYDFASAAGDHNIFALPIDLNGDGADDFVADGNQIIYSLPNGLNVYVSFDAAGKRVDEVSLALLQDPSVPDGIVRTGVSCMGCHVAGVIARDDDLRWELDEGVGVDQFTVDQLEKIRALYPERELFAALLGPDLIRFADALADAGVPLDAPEPVSSAFAAFAGPVTPRRAAAELWLSEAELLAQLPALSADLSELGQGLPVTRDVFTALYADSACRLQLGYTGACPGGF